MNRGGRPCHDYWEQAYFQRQYQDNKVVAFCSICEKTLSNTARARLQRHRISCSNDKTKKLTSVVHQKMESPEIVPASPSIANSTFINGSTDDQPINNAKYMFVVPVDCSNSPLIDPKIIETLSESLSNISPTKKRKLDQSCLDTWVDSISEAEKKVIDKALIQFFYSMNIGMDVVASQAFLDFMKALRPAYKPPTEEMMYELLDELLDDES